MGFDLGLGLRLYWDMMDEFLSLLFSFCTGSTIIVLPPYLSWYES